MCKFFCGPKFSALSKYQDVIAPHPHQHLAFSMFCIIDFSDRYVIISHFFKFIFLFPMLQSTFSYAYFTYLASVYLLQFRSFVHLLFRLLVLLLRFKDILYIWDESFNRPWKNFYPYLWLIFSVSWHYLRTEAFNFNEVQLISCNILLLSKLLLYFFKLKICCCCRLSIFLPPNCFYFAFFFFFNTCIIICWFQLLFLFQLLKKKSSRGLVFLSFMLLSQFFLLLFLNISSYL